MTAELADGAARETARLDLDRSVIVEAGAGTGKTTLLIDRIVFLLLGKLGKGSALEMSRLVALTFTEKAAAEIKFRLAQRLDQISALLREGPAQVPNPAAERCVEDLRVRFGRTDAEIRELAQAALRDIGRAQVGTIHSFCAYLLRLYPLEAGIAPDFRVDAGEEALEQLFDEEWALWLDGELGLSPPREAQWRGVLAQTTLGALRSAARSLVGARVDLDLAGDGVGAAPRLEESARACLALGEGQPPSRGKIKEYLAWMAESFFACAKAVRGERALRGPAPAARPPAWPASWDSSRAEAYERLAKAARRLDPSVEPLYREALLLLRPFVEALRESYRRRGWVTFDGLLVGARNLVRDNIRLREELKNRFGAFLVDEFQDTDPLQVELLMFLAETPSGAARRWGEVSPQPGKLFIVGDPKQSIYRFRGADIAALESFGGHLARHGAATVALQANFRSSPAVVESVNRVFGSVMRAQAGLQPAYVPIQPAGGSQRPPGPEPLWIHFSGPAPGQAALAAEERSAQGEWIARWIAENRASHRLRDIAVVLRSTSALGDYLEPLRRAGIPYVVEGEKYFYGTQEVADLVNWLKAVDDPEDRIALAGALRSPAGGLDDREIYALARAGALDYRRDPGPGHGEAREVFSLLRGLHEAAGRVPIGDLVSAVLRTTRLVEHAARAYSHQQTASNLLKLARLAGEASDRGETLKEFLFAAASSVRELREEGESPLADEDFDAVRILTIHKAKGLEYPVVILPNLGGRTAGGASGASVRVGWSWPAVGLRLEGSPANAAMVLLEDEEDLRQRQEEVRVLYVAMTRPKERLFLLGGAARGGQSLAALLERSACLPPRTLTAQAAGPGPTSPAPSGHEWEPTPASQRERWRARAAREAEALRRPLFRHPTEDSEGEDSAPHPAGPSGSGPVFGTLCHEVLERWDYARGRPLGGEGSLAELVSRRADWLARRHPSEDWASLRGEAQALLSRFLASPAGRALASAEILGREVPFSFSEDGAVVRGAIDLVYRDSRSVVVADFKTDAPGAGPSGETVQRHRRQGRRYVEAVERALGISGVRLEIVYLRNA